MERTDSICLNVRRADYVDLPASINTHGFIGREYYERGINLIAPNLKNPHIFITSDDIEWCRANLQFDYPSTLLGHEHKGLKFGNYLTLMSRCKHFLIPNSSFAWWAAWLSSSPEKLSFVPGIGFAIRVSPHRTGFPPDGFACNRRQLLARLLANHEPPLLAGGISTETVRHATGTRGVGTVRRATGARTKASPSRG